MPEISTTGLTLLIPDKPDVEREAVAAAWASLGGEVIRLAKFWRPPALKLASIRIYGPDTFGLVLADIYKLTLLEPPQDVAVHLPQSVLKRELIAGSLTQAFEWDYPIFIKPFAPKAFTARVYRTRIELGVETEGMSPSDIVLGSEVIAIVAEARAFVLDGLTIDCSIYEGKAAIEMAISCANEIASSGLFPAAVVLDLALLESGDWVFLEANAAWGAGLNGCNAERVIPIIERATRPKESLTKET